MDDTNITPEPANDQNVTNEQPSTDLGRRNVLGKMLGGAAAVAGCGALYSREAEVLAATLAPQGTSVDVAAPDGLSGASRLYTNWARLEDLKKKMTRAKLGKLTLSRMFLGGNLIGGWAHARDLIYVDDLVKAYHTREKIYATFQMGEACGMNAYMGHHSHIGIMVDYWEKKDGALQFLADCSDLEHAKRCIELGASACYIQGGVGDQLVQEGKFDVIERFLDFVREKGVPAGMGGHFLSTIQGCVDQGIEPDFWMKTIHHDRYWSRMKDKSEHDNVYCREPVEIKEFMASLKQPWIGFKVLAAGSIRPNDGFRFAFESGADFLCVGMYDFQVVDDVNICMDILESDINRKRPWRFT